MRIMDIMLGEFTHEAAQTRKVLERVPADKADWKPHDKSMSLSRIATHVADLAYWTAFTLDANELDLGGGYATPPFTTTEALLAYFDAGVEKSKQSLASF